MTCMTRKARALSFLQIASAAPKHFLEPVRARCSWQKQAYLRRVLAAAWHAHCAGQCAAYIPESAGPHEHTYLGR
eukprot:362247-Chlamydomonas_euryale.AAC.3